MALPPLFDKLRLPAVGAPQFIIANPELVIAQCKAGIVGAFPALNARPETALDDWLYRIKDELAAYDEANPDAPAAPYAVNQIVHKTNAEIEHDGQRRADSEGGPEADAVRQHPGEEK
jgi:nitronate monooxygenase